MFHCQRGVSLIEMMIAIVIMSILIAMGAPSFANFLANTKVRAAGESLLSGLQLARADAVRRNTAVEFLLTVDAPVADSAVAAAPSLAGANWMVRTAGGVFIEGKMGAESGGEQVAISANAASVFFDSFGRASTPATFQFSNPNAGNCVTAGGAVRCLNVVVSNAGRIRMCDPAATADVNDTRRC